MKSLLADVALPFSILFLLLSLGALYMAWSQNQHARELTRGGLLAVAQITDKTVFTPTRTHKDAPSTESGIPTYSLRFQFVHPVNGATVEGTAQVADAVWQAAAIGDHYRIVVSPTDPTLTSLFEGQEFVQGADLAWKVFGVLVVLTLACFVAWRWTRSG